MNVIVVVCNGFHLGFLGPYGNSWIETPNLDRLATEGVVFDNHFPENLTTLPTRRSWWTGRYGFPDPDAGWTALRHDEPILPDLLWNQGVHSALISDVPLLRDAGQGFGRGWDDVIWVRGQGYDPMVPPDDPRARRIKVTAEPGLPLPPRDDPDYDLWKDRWEQYLRNRAVLGPDEAGSGPARLIGAAVDWLQRRAADPAASGTPFCLWVDLFAPHGPWNPPAPYRDQYAATDPDEFEADEEGNLIEDEAAVIPEDVRVLIDVPAGAVGDVLSEDELVRLRRTYAGAVTHADHWLGVFFGALRATGRADDSLLVFTSDQGEPLGEHGYVRRFRPWLYEELIHTPLIVRLPKGEHGGTRQPALVQTVDLLPTILAALELPPDERAHGHDLLPLVRGEQVKVRDYACLGMDVEEYAIRTPDWHLTMPVEVDPDDVPRSPELFRKPEDRWDQNDVAGENPDVAEHLELVLRRFAEAVARDAIADLPPLRADRLGEGG